jgi:hypothetical protein
MFTATAVAFNACSRTRSVGLALNVFLQYAQENENVNWGFPQGVLILDNAVVVNTPPGIAGGSTGPTPGGAGG